MIQSTILEYKIKLNTKILNLINLFCDFQYVLLIFVNNLIQLKALHFFLPKCRFKLELRIFFTIFTILILNKKVSITIFNFNISNIYVCKISL